MEEVRIGVFDDDPDIRRIISDALKEEGYIPVEGKDGREALEIIRSTPLKLVIMDVMMPVEDGLMATVKLREFSNVPVLMLSAKTEEADRVTGLNMGADDYMVKPFYRSELLAKVRSMLRRYITLGSELDERNDVMTYYGLTLDTEKCRLLKDGEEIPLTATEFGIVKLLLSRPGRVFPAEEIYERVWGSEAYAVENTVMVHISRIRKKLETNPENPEYLKVVWGVGYKIEK